MNNHQELSDFFKSNNNICIALSGGVDSVTLLKFASKIIPEKIIAVTINTPYMFSEEIIYAEKLAKECNVKFESLKLLIPDEIVENPLDRCYLCKSKLFNQIIDFANRKGYSKIIDGTNASDNYEDRPGMRALEELGVSSPFRLYGYTKEKVRELAKELNLELHNKPSNSCKLTRLPCNQKIKFEDLDKVVKAENILKSFGLLNVRAKIDKTELRIQTTETNLLKVIESKNIIIDKLSNLGFQTISLDLRTR
jgi:uncharacterized protein